MLIIHGDDDEIIPVEMGRRLFAAAHDPKELYIIPGAHHNDTYLVGGKAYFERLKNFHLSSERHIGRPGPPEEIWRAQPALVSCRLLKVCSTCTAL